MKLGKILAAVFAVVILIELLALYRYLYLESKSEPPAALSQPVLRIDFASSERAAVWFLRQEQFVLSPYKLESGSEAGRENPFAEY